MTGGPMTEVVDNRPEQRFEAAVDGVTVGTLDYVVDGNVLVTTHTIVSREYERRGVGSQLAAAVLVSARDQDLRVRPECSFIARYIVKHPEFAGLLEA